MGDPVTLAFASTVISGAGGVMRAAGDASALGQKGVEAGQAAIAGRLAAKQNDTHLLEELKTTLSHIDAIRATTGANPFSPTGDAIRAEETRISDRERRIRVGNITSQARSDYQASQFYRRAARTAYAAGVVGTAGTALKGLSGR